MTAPTLNPRLAENVAARYKKAKAYVAQRKRHGLQTRPVDLAKHMGLDYHTAYDLIRRIRHAQL